MTPIFSGLICHSAARDQAQGALRVFQSSRRLRVRAGVRNAVFHEDTGCAGAVQPITDLASFEVHGEATVTAPREHEDGNSGVLAFGRVTSDRGRSNIG